MAYFTKKTTSAGQVQYRKDGNLVSVETVDEKMLAKLNVAPEGTKVPEDDQVQPTPENGVAKTPNVPAEQLVEIHLERNHMVNGKVYLGGYNTTVDPETNEVLEEDPIKIKVTKEMATELQRNDRRHTTYEKNLMRGQNLARVAPQVKEVKA